MKNLMLASLLLWSFAAAAGPKDKKPGRKVSQAAGSCGSQLWKGPRDLSRPQWVASLQNIARSDIREMAWGELLSNNPKPVFPVLLIYLAKTENVKLLAGYYEGILVLMNSNIRWRELVETWPQPVDLGSLNMTYWNLPKLCEEFKKAGGTL